MEEPAEFQKQFTSMIIIVPHSRADDRINCFACPDQFLKKLENMAEIFGQETVKHLSAHKLAVISGYRRIKVPFRVIDCLMNIHEGQKDRDVDVQHILPVQPQRRDKAAEIFPRFLANKT